MGRNSIINDENPIWWHLGRIVQTKNTRVWETQDRIGIVQSGDSSEESRPDYHRLKTMVKRSIEQNLRIKNFEAINGNYETSAVVKNQRVKQREQRNLGDCWQWKTNGQCSKGDNCSFRHDMDKRAKLTQPNPSPSFFHAAEWEKHVENPKSQRQEFQWLNVSMALQGLPQRDLHQFILWIVASSSMLVLQVGEWMPIWWKVLRFAPPGWRTAWQKV